MEAKKIIITGGATRIGSAIAKSLAGYDVNIVIHFNKSRKSALQLKMELEEIGAKVFLIKADLSNINQTKKIVPFAYKKMKGLDCLINNASLFEKDDLENFSDKSFSKHLDINLKAPAFLIKDFKRYVKNKEANIINIIDQRVKKLTPFFFSYTLSKAALATLTTTAAMKLAPNIRVNGIAPGITLLAPGQDQKAFEKSHRKNLLKSSSTVEEILNAIQLIISTKSMTGHVTVLDGGSHLAPPRRDVGL